MVILVIAIPVEVSLTVSEEPLPHSIHDDIRPGKLAVAGGLFDDLKV
jgi:hypothetical protein